MVTQEQKHRAHALCAAAIADGRLVRGACETCGKTEGRIDAHHDDYSKPLDIRWLCRSCHMRHHREGVDPSAVVALHAGGKRTLQAVGDRFGITRERVRQILDQQGVSQRKGGDPVDTRMHQARIDRYKAALRPGVSGEDAAKSLGETLAVIHRSAKALGVKLPKPFSASKVLSWQIAAYYVAHPEKTGREVAEHFGVSQNKVSDALQQTGTPSRRSGWTHAPDARSRTQDAAA